MSSLRAVTNPGESALASSRHSGDRDCWKTYLQHILCVLQSIGGRGTSTRRTGRALPDTACHRGWPGAGSCLCVVQGTDVPYQRRHVLLVAGNGLERVADRHNPGILHSSALASGSSFSTKKYLNAVLLRAWLAGMLWWAERHYAAGLTV